MFRILVIVSMTAVLLPAAVLSETAVYGIPPVDRIQIDGKIDDWGDRGFRVELLPDPQGRFLPADDFDARFRLGWNKGGLFMLVEVRDDIAHEHEELKRLWQEDCVEIFISEGRGSMNLVQLVLAPGADERFDSLRSKLYDHGAGGSERIVRSVQAGRVTEGGYVLEVFFPCDSIGISAAAGNELGFQLIANDADMEPGPSFRAAWFPGIGAHENPQLMHTIRLAEAASPPVTLHASRRSVMKGCELKITGAPEEMGSPYEISAGTASYEGTLAESAGRAGASVLVEETTGQGSCPSSRITVSGREIASFAEITSMKHILGRYADALGGRGPMERLVSRQCLCRSATEPVKHAKTGSDETRSAEESIFEVTVDAGGRWLYRDLSSDPPVLRGFDGADGWVQDANGIRREDLSGWGVTVWWIDPRGALRLDRYFDGLEVVTPEKDEGDGVDVISGRLPGGRAIRLVFDSGSGLLKKAGRLYFTDYQKTDGILIPHLVYFDSHNARTRFLIGEVRHNAPLESGMFDMPDPAEVFPDIFSVITDQAGPPHVEGPPHGARRDERPGSGRALPLRPDPGEGVQARP